MTQAYPPESGEPDPFVRKVTSKFAVALEALDAAQDAAEFEDYIWSKLDNDLRGHCRDNRLERIRGIEHRAHIDTTFYPLRSKVYTATSFARVIDI